MGAKMCGHSGEYGVYRSVLPYQGYSNQSEYNIRGVERVIYPGLAARTYRKQLRAGESEWLACCRLAKHLRLYCCLSQVKHIMDAFATDR